MYPAVPNIAGTKMTYANEIQAVRLVQRKYLCRLVVMSAMCQSRCPPDAHLPTPCVSSSSLSRIFALLGGALCVVSRDERTVPFHDGWILVEHYGSVSHCALLGRD